MRVFPAAIPCRPAFAVLLLAASGTAQPLLLIDTAFVHGEAAANRPEAPIPLRTSVPADWASPVAYASGTAHFRLEILAKPTGTAIRYQPCMERGTSRACAQARILSDSGVSDTVHTWSQGLSQWTPTGMSWTARPDRFVLILQDAYGNPIVPPTTGGSAPVWVGQPYLSLYYPMSVRFSAAVMPQSASFPGWDGFIPTSTAPARHARGGEAASRLILLGGNGMAAGLGVRSAEPGPVHGPADGADAVRDVRGRSMPAKAY